MQRRRSQVCVCPSSFGRTFCSSLGQLVHPSPPQLGLQLCQMPQQLTKRMHKTSKVCHTVLLDCVGELIIIFCSPYHVWSRLRRVHTSSLPRVAPLGFRYCDQAGGLVAPGPGRSGRREDSGCICLLLKGITGPDGHD